MVTTDDEPRGVVIDLDFSVEVDRTWGVPDNAPSSAHRTGTTPFMAVDYLVTPTCGATSLYPQFHLPRYDIESFIWVFTWLIHKDYSNDDLTNPPDNNNARLHEQWDTQNYYAAWMAKLGFAAGGFLNGVQPRFASLKPLLAQFMDLIDGIHREQKAIELDDPRIQRSLLWDKHENKYSAWFTDVGKRMTFEAVTSLIVPHLDAASLAACKQFL